MAHEVTPMTQIAKSRWILCAAAAAAALPILSSVASAQYRVNTSGQALDANNRIGSGGRNESNPSARPGVVTGNDIVTGNVTGGKQFRGRLDYTDPGAFRGPTAGRGSDNFIRE